MIARIFERKEENKLNDGDKRIAHKFLWLPKKINGKIKWLRDSYWVEVARFPENQRELIWEIIDWATKEDEFNIWNFEISPEMVNLHSADIEMNDILSYKIQDEIDRAELTEMLKSSINGERIYSSTWTHVSSDDSNQISE